MKVIFLLGGNSASRKDWKDLQDPLLYTFIEGYEYSKMRLMNDLQSHLFKGKTCIVDLNVPHGDIKSFARILGEANVLRIRVDKPPCKG